MHHLYQGWEGVAEDIIVFIQNVFKTGNNIELFEQLEEQEKRAKDVLIEFQQEYPNTVTESNADAILKQLQSIKPKNIEGR